MTTRPSICTNCTKNVNEKCLEGRIAYGFVQSCVMYTPKTGETVALLAPPAKKVEQPPKVTVWKRASKDDPTKSLYIAILP